MTMTVRELRELLEGLDGDVEVRIAHQPSWPFELSVGDTALVEPEDDGEGPGVLYLSEGEQLGYLPGHARDALCWGR